MIKIPCGVSARHIHLCQPDIDKLFGAGYEFKKLKDTYNPGYIACEKVSIEFESGLRCDMHLVFPNMPDTQIEISTTDCYKFKIRVPKNISGDITNGGSATITNPDNGKSIFIKNCVIRTRRHLHLDNKQAKSLNLKNNQTVSIETGDVIFKDVIVRVKDVYRASFHIDTDEGNAGTITDETIARILND